MASFFPFSLTAYVEKRLLALIEKGRNDRPWLQTTK
jgi:hypothetical protein